MKKLIQTCYAGRRLGSLFQIKGSTKKEHEHVFHYVNCPEKLCDYSYIGRDNEFHVLSIP